MKKTDSTSAGEDARKLGRKWIERIDAATKYEKAWLDDARTATDVYTGDTTSADGETVRMKDGQYDFNILYANVETIVPAVINSSPIPDIRRRWGEDDPAARVVAQVIERAILVQIDDSRLQTELEAVAQDAFLAGRGVPRIRFWADLAGETTDEQLKSDAERVEGDPGVQAGSAYPMSDDGAELEEAAEGLAPPLPPPGLEHIDGPPLERVENERIEFEAVPWIDYRHGPAKRWNERPWEAFRFCIPREQANSDFFEQGLIHSQISETEAKDRRLSDKDLVGWEIWDKAKREVLFIDDNSVILKRVPDPLGLSGFFCTPTPVQPIEVNGRLTPVNPFSVYRRLAEDLDKAVRRKHTLVDAMRAKGWYGMGKDDLSSVINLGDNEFAPIADPDIWAANGGIEKAIAFWPIERFIAAIQQLDAAIAQYKQWIYEITGISDIIRGASVATETATAQNIKSQWGSLRIQKMQRMMERCARELFIMMSEIIPTKFTPETLEKMTGIKLVPRPEDPPEVLQQKAEIINLMRQPLSAYYRIDVESDSTVRADLTRQKQELASFLQSAGAYFSAVGPLVKDGSIPADAAAEIFAANARMFNLGRSVEDVLEKMISEAKERAGQPMPPDPKKQEQEAKQKAEAEKAQALNAKMMADAQKTQAEAEKIAADAEAARQQTQERFEQAARKAESEGIAAQQQAIIDALARDIKEIERDIKRIELDKAQIGLDQTQIEAVTKPIIETTTAKMEMF